MSTGRVQENRVPWPSLSTDPESGLDSDKSPGDTRNSMKNFQRFGSHSAGNGTKRSTLWVVMEETMSEAEVGRVKNKESR
jgi:hypothetical protein